MEVPATSPSDVAPADRKKAQMVFGLLIAGFIVYCVFIIYTAYDARQDPATNVQVTSKDYVMPSIMICSQNYVNTSGSLILTSQPQGVNTEVCLSGCDGNGANTNGFNYLNQGAGLLPGKVCWVYQQPTNPLLLTDSGIQKYFMNVTMQFYCGGFTGGSCNHLFEIYVTDCIPSNAQPTVALVSQCTYLEYGPKVVAGAYQGHLSVVERYDLKNNLQRSFSISTFSLLPYAGFNAPPNPSITGGMEGISLLLSNDRGLVTIVSQIDPVNWPAMIGQMAGFWTIVAGVFGFLFTVKVGHASFTIKKKEDKKQQAPVQADKEKAKLPVGDSSKALEDNNNQTQQDTVEIEMK